MAANFTTADYIAALVKTNTVGWPIESVTAFQLALEQLAKLAQAELILKMRQDTARAVGLDPLV